MANRFVKEYGVVRVSIGEAIRRVLTTQKRTELGRAIQEHLVQGLTVPDELAIRAVEVMLMDTKCTTRG